MSTRLAFASALGSAAVLLNGAILADETIDRSRVEQGFASSPIPASQLSLNGKDIQLIGLGGLHCRGALAGALHRAGFGQRLPDSGHRPRREPAAAQTRVGHPDAILFRDGAGSRRTGCQSKRYRAPLVDQ
jgi:hypothetical protein